MTLHKAGGACNQNAVQFTFQGRRPRHLLLRLQASPNEARISSAKNRLSSKIGCRRKISEGSHHFALR